MAASVKPDGTVRRTAAPRHAVTIDGLSAGLVPHRQWPLRQWFLARSRRYYHARTLHRRFTPAPRFYQDVDPALRKLCRLLHGIGIRTTASCEGHDHGREYFEARWEALCSESQTIRREGLMVTESEGGHTFRFRNTHYRLPWRRFGHFLRDSLSHQATGYLGVIIPASEPGLNQRWRDAARRLRDLRPVPDPALGRRFGGQLYHLTVQCPRAEERYGNWQRLTDWVQEEFVDR